MDFTIASSSSLNSQSIQVDDTEEHKSYNGF